jgi:Fic family protein
MISPISNRKNSVTTPVGQIALHQQLDLKIPEPWTCSYVGSGTRRTITDRESSREYYPPQYATDGSLIENLRFAFKYEPLDLRIVVASLRALGSTGVVGWVKSEPTGSYSRRAWFFYEKFIGPLDLENASSGNYVDALDEKLHYVAQPVNSKRHRVKDNLLGNGQLCPVIRRTPKLSSMENWDLGAEALAITQSYQPDIASRAVSYLYTKETRSSFEIESESPSPDREHLFLKALREAPNFLPVTQEKLVELQGSIVDSRYAASGWRAIQNFVGQTTQGFGERVDFICPKPQDVPQLMDGWMEMSERLSQDACNAVVAAAACSFTFVFIHPFEDGNGRLHRFVIHAMLAAREFTPTSLVLPVSAAILRHRTDYDSVLESFSKPIMGAICWHLDDEQSVVVTSETQDLYRFCDLTLQAEFLYERLAESVRIDLVEGAQFLERFDRVWAVVRKIDMPDQRAKLLVKLLLQNQGRLARRKREQFSELTDQELKRIESETQQILERSRPLESVGWTEKAINDKLQEPGILKDAICAALDVLAAEWEDPSEVDELDSVDEYWLEEPIELKDICIDRITQLEQVVQVEISFELHFELGIGVSLHNPDDRIVDPEDRSITVFEPAAVPEKLQQEFSRLARVWVDLSTKSFQVARFELEDRGALQIEHPWVDKEPWR